MAKIKFIPIGKGHTYPGVPKKIRGQAPAPKPKK